MKRVYTGLESSGKSLQLAVEAQRVYKRNKKWFFAREALGLPPIKRTMAFASPMSEKFVASLDSTVVQYTTFRNLTEVLQFTEADIFIDELIKFFPSSGSNSLSMEQLDFLTQGAKNGVNMFCASQDFSQVHKQFRLLVNEVFVVTKLIGSRRPMKSAPPVNNIWGLCALRPVAPSSFKGDSATMESLGFPSFYFITREHCELFDTSYRVPLSSLPPIKVRRQLLVGEDLETGEKFRKVRWV